jgi:hypothetical protein
MSAKSPAEKLRLKPGMSATFLHLPEGLRDRLGVPEGVNEADDPVQADFILDFASTQAEAAERLTALAPSIRPGAVTWMAYPKGSKAAGYDISRDTIWQFAQTVGLVLNANVAIDDKLSAVRMRPL